MNTIKSFLSYLTHIIFTCICSCAMEYDKMFMIFLNNFGDIIIDIISFHHPSKAFMYPGMIRKHDINADLIRRITTWSEENNWMLRLLTWRNTHQCLNNFAIYNH